LPSAHLVGIATPREAYKPEIGAERREAVTATNTWHGGRRREQGAGSREKKQMSEVEDKNSVLSTHY
jgi:hypothetical protein